MKDLAVLFTLKVAAVNSGHIKNKVDDASEAKVH